MDTVSDTKTTTFNARKLQRRVRVPLLCPTNYMNQDEHQEWSACGLTLPWRALTPRKNENRTQKYGSPPLTRGALSGKWRCQIRTCPRITTVVSPPLSRRTGPARGLGRRVQYGLTNQYVSWDRLPACRIAARVTGWKPIPRTNATVIDQS